MWSGPDGPLGPAEVAAEGSFAGPLANHDRYGGAYLAWFFLTGKRRLPTYFPVKSLEFKFVSLSNEYVVGYR